MQIFIDTNVYLDFYELSDDDLTQLKQLETLLTAKPATLLVSQQVRDEFVRNRDSQIKDSLTFLKNKKIDGSFPRLCTEYSEYDEIKSTIKVFEEKKNVLIENISNDAAQLNLEADKLIKGLFEFGERLPVTNEIMQQARMRHEKGNPPGKNKTIGDEINWECILKYYSNLQADTTDTTEIDLFIISGDGDFASTLDKTSLNHFLTNEWNQKIPNGKISFFPKLRAFFEAQFPEIKLSPSSLDRHLAVVNFVNSWSFRRTHQLIDKLKQFDNFTEE